MGLRLIIQEEGGLGGEVGREAKKTEKTKGKYNEIQKEKQKACLPLGRLSGIRRRVRYQEVK